MQRLTSSCNAPGNCRNGESEFIRSPAKWATVLRRRLSAGVTDITIPRQPMLRRRIIESHGAPDKQNLPLNRQPQPVTAPPTTCRKRIRRVQVPWSRRSRAMSRPIAAAAPAPPARPGRRRGHGRSSSRGNRHGRRPARMLSANRRTSSAGNSQSELMPIKLSRARMRPKASCAEAYPRSGSQVSMARRIAR